MEKTTMSVQELSAQMGISLPKAYELVKEPGFPTIKVGARILIPVEAFREWLTAELKSLGYKAKEETNGHFKAHNILVGDPEKTAVLFVTHMDTPARWLLPDMLFPRNYFLWGMWQLLHMGLLLVPAVLVYLGIWQISGQNAQLGLWGLVLTYLALLLLSQYGPANRVNRSEDADLAAMLTLMDSFS